MPKDAKLVGLYVAMLGAAAAAFALVRRLGASLEAAGPPGSVPFGSPATVASMHGLVDLLLALLVVVAAARLLGVLLSWTGQPPVVGEIVAGILLGPSLLGRVAPAAAASLFPPHVSDHLGVVAQLGIIAFMFLVGLQLDLRQLRNHSRAMIVISHASIVVPFVMGVSLALYLYPRYATRDPSLFAMLVLMAIVTTATTTPILQALTRGAPLTQDAEARP